LWCDQLTAFSLFFSAFLKTLKSVMLRLVAALFVRGALHLLLA